MKRATVVPDGKTITVRIPITFRRRGARKLVVTPDGAERAPRPRVDNAIVKALARAFRYEATAAGLAPSRTALSTLLLAATPSEHRAHLLGARYLLD